MNRGGLRAPSTIASQSQWNGPPRPCNWSSAASERGTRRHRDSGRRVGREVRYAVRPAALDATARWMPRSRPTRPPPGARRGGARRRSGPPAGSRRRVPRRRPRRRLRRAGGAAGPRGRGPGWTAPPGRASRWCAARRPWPSRSSSLAALPAWAACAGERSGGRDHDCAGTAIRGGGLHGQAAQDRRDRHPRRPRTAQPARPGGPQQLTPLPAPTGRRLPRGLRRVLDRAGPDGSLWVPGHGAKR